MASPIVNKTNKPDRSMTFYGAIAEIMNGKRLTRIVWGNKGHYCFLKDGLLTLHKAGELESKTYSWIINDGDITGVDWVVLDEKN
jgi:hypothetical protein